MPRRARRVRRKSPRISKNRRVRRFFRQIASQITLKNTGRVIASFASPVLKLSICVTIFGSVVLGYWWLSHSDRFAVSNIQIQGNQRVSDDQLRAQIALVAPEQNIFRLALSDLETAIERDPWIERADIKRSLPNTLVVTVKEKQASGIVALNGLYLTTASGRIFKRAAISRGEASGLPVITGLTREEYQNHPTKTQQRIATGLLALGLFRSIPSLPEIGELHLDRERGATFMTRNTATAIRIGDISDTARIKRRIWSLQAAWATLEQKERALAHTIYLTQNAKTDRIAVDFRRGRATH